MKNNTYIILLILSIIIGIIVLICFITSNYNGAFIIIFPMLLLMYFTFFWLWKTNPNQIKEEEINIVKGDNKEITVTYKNQSFKTTITGSTRTNMIPKIDIDGNKINLIKRETLHNYLKKNYDSLSIPNDMIAITDNEVKKFFTNMTICTDDLKYKYLHKKHFFIGYPIILFFILFNLSTLIQGIRDNTISLGFTIFLIVLVLILILSYMLRRSELKKEQNAEIYSCKVDIYDKKEELVGEGDISYYIRVYNGDKHILTKWFNVDRSFYQNGTYGTLYLTVMGDKCYTDFEKGED